MGRRPLPAFMRGYNYQHQKERKRWAASIAIKGYTCTRCHRYAPPGSQFHLDHNDDRSGYLGAAHPYCNTQAGGRKAQRLARRASSSRNW